LFDEGFERVLAAKDPRVRANFAYCGLSQFFPVTLVVKKKFLGGVGCVVAGDASVTVPRADVDRIGPTWA